MLRDFDYTTINLGYFLLEVVSLECIQSADKGNAQQWAQVYKVMGWHWRYNILGKHDWYNVANPLPTFTLLDHTNQGVEESIKSTVLKFNQNLGQCA